MKFLFTVTDFDMGGITTSLKNLSSELVRRGHEVSILNLPNIKDNLKFDSNVTIIPLRGKSKYWEIGLQNYKKAKGIKKIALLLFGIFKKALSKFGLWEKFIFSGQPEIECDIAIAYRQSSICYYICKQKTTAKKTIAFIHSEFSGDCSSWLSYLCDIDKIACVSDDWSTQFRKTFPHLKDKVCTVYNLFNAEELIKKSEQYIPTEMDNNYFNLVTSARIDFWPKRLNLIPEICNKLVNRGIHNFKWYLVGDGPDREKLEKIICDTKTEDYIVLLGAKDNPYPYVKNADLFVLLSDWESYGMVVQEAMILGTPILASKYPALFEIMEDKVHGLITEKDTESIAEGLEKLYSDNSLYHNLKNNCMDYSYSSDTVYNQLMKICQ